MLNFIEGAEGTIDFKGEISKIQAKRTRSPIVAIASGMMRTRAISYHFMLGTLLDTSRFTEYWIKSIDPMKILVCQNIYILSRPSTIIAYHEAIVDFTCAKGSNNPVLQTNLQNMPLQLPWLLVFSNVVISSD